MTVSPQTDPLLPSEVKNWLIGFIAVLALFAFAVIYLIIFYYTFQLGGDDGVISQRLNDPQLLSVSTGLTGLVGGVVAVALGQQQASATSTEGSLTRWFTDMSWKKRLAALYVLVYIIMGIAAAVVWIVASNDAPDTVKALASVALGLLIPVVRTYFIPGEPPSGT